jgi:hypothetical protein
MTTATALKEEHQNTRAHKSDETPANFPPRRHEKSATRHTRNTEGKRGNTPPNENDTGTEPDKDMRQGTITTTRHTPKSEGEYEYYPTGYGCQGPSSSDNDGGHISSNRHTHGSTGVTANRGRGRGLDDPEKTNTEEEKDMTYNKTKADIGPTRTLDNPVRDTISEESIITDAPAGTNTKEKMGDDSESWGIYDSDKELAQRTINMGIELQTHAIIYSGTHPNPAR